jgi:hypothetical protein
VSEDTSSGRRAVIYSHLLALLAFWLMLPAETAGTPAFQATSKQLNKDKCMPIILPLTCHLLLVCVFWSIAIPLSAALSTSL